MRKIITSLFIFSMTASAGVSIDARVEYLSPAPGSALVSTRAHIILRSALPLAKESAGPNPIIHVEGSKSGVHAGRYVIADDGRTVVFTPDSPFRAGEVVSVTTNRVIALSRGTGISELAFQFTVTPKEYLTEKPRPLEEALGLTTASGTLGSPPSSAPAKQQVNKTSGMNPLFPINFPPITVTTQGATAPGRLFLSNFAWTNSVVSTTFLMILDNSGGPYYYKEMSGSDFDFKLQPNGHLTYFDFNAGAYMELDSTYNIVNTYSCSEGYLTDLHDLRLLPNGHALLMGTDRETIDMSTIVPGGNPGATVLGLIIQEFDKDKNVVFDWRSWDHFKITDATHLDLTTSSVDYVHANALDVDTDGNILLSARHMDEITKIDRSTGDIIWRMGGKNNEFAFLNDTLGFSHQHAVRRIDNGNITLFDNGNYHATPSSRAVEYRVDEVNRTVTEVWEYRNSPETYGSAMGYVERLPNGNTLIGWGATNPTVTEVTSDGNKVFELTFPPGVVSYRAYRYPWDVGSSIEDVREDQAGTLLPGTIVLNDNYPNPFNPSTKISFMLGSTGDATLKVFNLLGQEVATLASGTYQAGQVHSVGFDASHLPSGVYCYQLQSGYKTEVKKMLLLK